MPLQPLRDALANALRLPSGRVAIVGNAPGPTDLGDWIDAAPAVVRFNQPFGLDAGRGARTTHLFLVSAGGQAAEWALDPGFGARPAPARADWIVLAHDPAKDAAPAKSKRSTLATDTRDACNGVGPLLGALHRTDGIALLGAKDHRAASRDLARFSDRTAVEPSTGFLALHAILARRPASAMPIELYGFGFAGWDGHDWQAERRWVASAVSAGRAVLARPG